MSALLLLLLLLSVATIASRPGSLADVLDRIATPVLVVVGVGLGPEGIAVINGTLTTAFSPALAIGVTWIGILVGLRASSHEGRTKEARAIARTAVVAVLATTTSVLLAGLAMAAPTWLGWRVPDAPGLWSGAALILGGALVGAPPGDRDHRAELALRSSLIEVGDLIAMVCAVVALAVLPSWSALTPTLAAAVVVGSGLLLALVQRLLGGGATGDGSARMIALLGVVAVAAGLLHEAGLPSAVAGLVAGTALGRTDAGRALAELLLPSERPARIVVVFLVGVTMKMSSTALLVGALLAAGQLAVQLVATSWAVGHRPSSAALAAGLLASSVPLVVATSFALAGFPEGGLLVSSAAVAVVCTDLFAAAILFGSRARHAARTGLPRQAP
jgi:hypothetical protein